MIALLARRRTTRLALALIMTAVAIAARAEGSGRRIALEIGRAQELARGASDEVLAKRAAAQAALKAVDAARANFFPKLTASLSGAYLVNPPDGMTIKANSIPIILTNPATGWALIDPQSPLPNHVAEAFFPPADLTLFPDAKSTYFKGNLTFTQPLLTWGKIRAAVDLASLEASVASIGSGGAALDAVRSANRAYYSALLSREGSAILAELRGFAASILQDLQASLEAGFATKEQLLSSQAELSGLDAKLVQAREGEESSLEALALLTGLDPGSIELASTFRARLPSFDEGRLKEAALGASTELGVARARLAQAKRKLDLERGSATLLPDLSFFASLDASGQNLPFASSSWKDTWSWDLSLGIAAKADLFDGGAALARRREAAASIEAARIGESATEKAARLQARRAIDAARGAEASLREREARAAWAAEALRNARARDADQAISRSELNAAAIGEASARLELLYSRYALEEAIADLERLAGRDAAGGSL